MNESLKDDLITRSKADQEMRNRASKDGFESWDPSVDEDNTTYLRQIVSRTGWPKISDVGEEAARAAWLLVQHADHDPVFQAHCLDLIKSLPAGDVAS